MNSLPLRCVIFDCDGTLVDSEFICNDALRMQLQAEGVDEDAHQLMGRYRGAKLQNIVDDLQARHQARFDPDFVRAYRQKVEALFATDLRSVSGVVEALSRISLPMCVASSGPVAKIRQALQVTGLLPFFEDRIFSSYEVGSWKPEPGLFAFAAQAMGVDPAQCAVVEDSELGIVAAGRAGMRPFWYMHGAQPDLAVHPGARAFHDMALLPGLLRQ